MPSNGNQGGYSSLPVDDHAIIDDVRLLAGEMGDGGQKETPQRRTWLKRAGLPGALYQLRWLMDGLLIAFIMILLIERVWFVGDKKKPLAHEVGDDITGFAPRFSHRTVTFHLDPAFMPENRSEFFSDDVRQKWLGIVPTGLGFVKIEQPENYRDLPTKVEGFYDKYVVTTSMTHQLHCLYAIAQVYSAYTSGNHEKIPLEPPWHITHCFEYIRQAIMCAGDVSLEGRQTTFPEGVNGSDGWDAKHVCKSYDEVLAYLEENRALDEQWI